MASGPTHFDTDCKLMLHMNGTDLSTTFTDSSTVGRTFSVGAVTANLTTADKVFGTASGNFDATGYITAPNTTDFDFGNGDLTLDFRFQTSNSAATTYIVTTTDTSFQNGWFLTRNAAGFFHFVAYSGGTIVRNITWTTTITNGQWYHIALNYASGTAYLMQDGILQTASVLTNSGAIGASTNVIALFAVLSGIWTTSPAGKIDELRIVKGTAVWTSSFTPPSSEYISGPEPLEEISSYRNLSLLGVG